MNKEYRKNLNVSSSKLSVAPNINISRLNHCFDKRK